MQSLGQSAVRSNADRLSPSHFVDPLGVLVPVRLSQAKPVKLHTGVADALDVAQRALGEAVLPGIDTGLFTALEQCHDPFGRVPDRHVLAEQLVEMGIAIERVASKNEA